MVERMTEQSWKPGDWKGYFDAVAGKPPRETLVAALANFEADGRAPAEGRMAVGLGCGERRASAGSDSEGEGMARSVARVPESARGRLTTMVARFEDAALPECDLLNASYSIPHCDPRDFPVLWARIVASIRPGGRFAGQIFGVNDGWAQKPDGVTRTYHTRAQVEAMLAGFDAEMLDEWQKEGKNAYGEPKYWHVFHVVARKKR